jgi:hypothetical protein
LAVEEATLEGAFLGMIGEAPEDVDRGAGEAGRPDITLPPGRLGGLP